jgi:hypothetical protein
MSTEHWTVDITCRADRPTHICEAHAVLTAGLDHLAGHGIATKNPADADLPAVGAELAVARALSDLADQLQALAGTEIEAWIPTNATIRLPDPARLTDPFAGDPAEPAPCDAVAATTPTNKAS